MSYLGESKNSQDCHRVAFNRCRHLLGKYRVVLYVDLLYNASMKCKLLEKESYMQKGLYHWSNQCI